MGGLELMNPRSKTIRTILLRVSFVFFCALLNLPVYADTTCLSGNLSNLIGTTCDIGTLQFNFEDWNSTNFTYDASDATYTYSTAATASDFTFTVLSNGFTLTTSWRSVVGPGGSNSNYAWDFGALDYTVTSLTGAILSQNMTGNGFAALGSYYSFADVYAYTNDPPCPGCAANWVSGLDGVGQGTDGTYGMGPNSIAFGDPFASGTGHFEFNLVADGTDSANWGGGATLTYTTTTPEPGSLVPLALGLVGIVGFVTKRSRAKLKS